MIIQRVTVKEMCTSMRDANWNLDPAILLSFAKSFWSSFDSGVGVATLFHVIMIEVDEMNVILACTVCISP